MCIDTSLVAGANCPDGTLFLSKVPGSVWHVNQGVYLLESCPTGYELTESSQECALCPAFSFCEGGSMGHIPCSGGLFAPPGSNSSISCVRTVFIVIAFDVPVFISDFSTTDQENLKQDLALIAEIPSGNVIFESLGQVGSSLTQVVCMLASVDSLAADKLKAKLTTYFASLSLNAFPGSILNSITVTACKAGYELIVGADSHTGSDGTCQLCPAYYYCTGGSSSRVSCPSGSFAPPGSNSSMVCSSAFFMTVIASLAMPIENFTTVKQDDFIQALASTASINVDRVMVLSIKTVGQNERRMQGSSIQVSSQLSASNPAAAAAMYSNLQVSTLNAKLSAFGLPSGTLISVSSPLPTYTDGRVQPWVIAVSIVAGFLVLSLAIAGTAWATLQKDESEEERILARKVVEIRKDLRLTQKDGFLVGSERPLFWRGEIIFLRRNHLEAVARLALCQDFDVHLFDAFSLSLEGLGESGSVGEDRHSTLCEWLLERAVALISPDISSEQAKVVLDAESTQSSYSTRFRFFVNRVSKIRIWAENEELFHRLQSRAQDLMDEIAALCDKRYQALRLEPEGAELTSFHPLDNCSNKRQDHPEVGRRAISASSHRKSTQSK